MGDVSQKGTEVVHLLREGGGSVGCERKRTDSQKLQELLQIEMLGMVVRGSQECDIAWPPAAVE